MIVDSIQFFTQVLQPTCVQNDIHMNVTGHCPRHEVDLYVYKRMASQTTVSFCSANVILCIHISNIMITSIYDRRLRFFISGVLMILITITACYACKFPLRLLQYHEFWIKYLPDESFFIKSFVATVYNYGKEFTVQYHFDFDGTHGLIFNSVYSDRAK